MKKENNERQSVEIINMEIYFYFRRTVYIIVLVRNLQVNNLVILKRFSMKKLVLVLSLLVSMANAESFFITDNTYSCVDGKYKLEFSILKRELILLNNSWTLEFNKGSKTYLGKVKDGSYIVFSLYTNTKQVNIAGIGTYDCKVK